MPQIGETVSHWKWDELQISKMKRYKPKVKMENWVVSRRDPGTAGGYMACLIGSNMESNLARALLATRLFWILFVAMTKSIPSGAQIKNIKGNHVSEGNKKKQVRKHNLYLKSKFLAFFNKLYIIGLAYGIPMLL